MICESEDSNLVAVVKVEGSFSEIILLRLLH